VTNKIFSV